MACNPEPEQLSLIDLDSYDTFRRALLGSQGHQGPLLKPWETSSFNPAAHFLSNWKKVNGLVSASSWTKKLLTDLNSRVGGEPAGHLARAYGAAFQGDEVGVLGRDIVEFCLHSDHQEVRRGAVAALEHWLDDDEDGTWFDIINDHLDLELEPELKARCQQLVEDRLEDIDDEDTMYNDDPPEFQEYYAINKKLGNRSRGQLETQVLPAFLWRLLDVPTGITLGLLESLQIGKLVTEDPNYEFVMTPVGDGWQVRAWKLDGTRTFSIEPTATEGSWLVFSRFAK